MNKKQYLIWSISLFVIFAIFTLLIGTVDVAAIGPKGSSVGFSTLNGWFFSMVGEHEVWYKITNWKWPLCWIFIFTYGLTGLIQLIKRKNMLKVDPNILALGVFYLVILGTYFIFEKFSPCYSPSLMIDGDLRPSYPSTTVLIAVAVLVSSVDQTNKYIKNAKVRKIIAIASYVLASYFIVGRIISGVHWITDIIASLLFVAADMFLYHFLKILFAELFAEKSK